MARPASRIQSIEPSGLAIVAAASALPGVDLPGVQLDNAGLTELMEEAACRVRSAGILRTIPISTPEFPSQRLGIESRPILDQTFTSRDLALCAARKALAQADIDPASIQGVLVSTVTPDSPYPAIATTVHDALGCRPEAVAYDISLGCSGSLVALQAASQLLRAKPLGSTAVIVGTETLVRSLDATDRGTCPIFGDGAGAIVIQRTEDGDLGTVRTWTSGSQGPRISRPMAPPGKGPMLRFCARDGRAFVREDRSSRAHVRLDGTRVFRDMIRQVPRSLGALLDAERSSSADVDLFLLHQANGRMLAAIAADEALAIDPQRMPVRIERTGNLASASVPILLSQCLTEGLVTPGKRLVLCAFGSGYSLGSVSLTWTAQPQTQATPSSALSARTTSPP